MSLTSHRDEPCRPLSDMERARLARSMREVDLVAPFIDHTDLVVTQAHVTTPPLSLSGMHVFSVHISTRSQGHANG